MIKEGALTDGVAQLYYVQNQLKCLLAVCVIDIIIDLAAYSLQTDAKQQSPFDKRVLSVAGSRCVNVTLIFVLCHCFHFYRVHS